MMRNALTISTLFCLVSFASVEAETSQNSREVERKNLAECVAAGSMADCRVMAQDAVAERPERTILPMDVLRLLDDNSKPFLRELVRQSKDSDFHYAGAASLAHMGDAEIVPELQERKRRFEQQGERNAAGLMRHYLWQIDVQQTPKRLLGYIAK